MITTAEKESYILSFGYTIDSRQSFVKPEHPGKFMITDPLDDTEKGYAIVGDDRGELINECYEMLVAGTHR